MWLGTGLRTKELADVPPLGTHAPPTANTPVQAWASVLEPTLTLIESEANAMLELGRDANPSLNRMLPMIGVAEAEVPPNAAAATTAIAHRLKIVCDITSLVDDDDNIKAFAMPCILSVVDQ